MAILVGCLVGMGNRSFPRTWPCGVKGNGSPDGVCPSLHVSRSSHICAQAGWQAWVFWNFPGRGGIQAICPWVLGAGEGGLAPVVRGRRHAHAAPDR